MNIISGCYNCTERSLVCHSNCPKYLEYKQYLQKIKDKKEQERASYPLIRRRKVYVR